MPAPIYRIDEGYKAYATQTQAKIIDAINEGKSMNAAAAALGMNKSTIRDAVEAVKKKASIFGFSPEHNMTRPVPETHVAKGVSTFYNKDGKVTGQWVKSSLDDQKALEVKKAALSALAEELPRLPPIPAPAASDKSLATVYTLTDSHVGAMCWHKEGGADWDLKIAEATLVGCFEKMVAASPVSHTAVVAQLGDFLHQDGINAVTPTSGHLLDADGRFTKVVQVAVRVLRRVVDMSLAKHQKVFVLMAEGNHDISSSIWLRTLFAALYENEPRIEVIDSPLPYYAIQHGLTMLGWHHGHLKKNDQLPLLFATEFSVMWGATKKRYIHTGHRHHVEEKEHSGATVMQHTTITARDAHASRHGYHSERAVTAVTYHNEFGKHSTVTICPEMLETV